MNKNAADAKFYKNKSKTLRFAASTFESLRSIYIAVVVWADECPRARAIVSSGMSSDAAIVAHEWRAQYVVSPARICPRLLLHRLAKCR